MRFDGPRRVPPGRSLWRVENRGRVVHPAFIARLAPGRTAEDVEAELLAHTPGLPESVDSPGEYVIGCVLEGHHLMGMLQPLTVTP